MSARARAHAHQRRAVRARETATVGGPRERELTARLADAHNNIELLNESIADLEREFSEPGWVRYTAIAEREFSAQRMLQLRAACRLYDPVAQFRTRRPRVRGDRVGWHEDDSMLMP